MIAGLRWYVRPLEEDAEPPNYIFKHHVDQRPPGNHKTAHRNTPLQQQSSCRLRQVALVTAGSCDFLVTCRRLTLRRTVPAAWRPARLRNGRHPDKGL